MGTLQDGLMLFTRDGRVVLVSASAERFAGRHRSDMLGHNVEQIFDDSSRLGRHRARRLRPAPAALQARN